MSEIADLAPKEIEKSIGSQILGMIFKVDVVHVNQFLHDHSIEFRLSVLDQVFKIVVPAANIGEAEVRNIWTEIFSNFLAVLNEGLAVRDKKSKK